MTNPPPFSPLPQIAAAMLVPVVVIDDARRAAPLGRALVDGGVDVIEVTLRTEAAVDAIGHLAETGDVMVGAGTVLTGTQVDEAVSAGAKFVISPGFSAEVSERCLIRDVSYLPGAVTATEIQNAIKQGHTALKFFPAEAAGGAAALRALTAPFQSTRFIPTGGITPANLGEYLSIDAVAAVGGTWIAAPETVAAGEFRRIQELAAEGVAIARRFRPERVMTE
ncbi:MAG: bifunctional 4-hydroxy-2-oxoglutarate aldolase/2-dehydro-3-deoxy-phosphogluconate aldolase [Actinomycetota bacterium]|nr:bifunctional 4-hydroxy-2-oxoglutarate aldolase/2-dehydro-3-deoxy-phosphogluconate aldolase [Actinomycetota bacterium]